MKSHITIYGDVKPSEVNKPSAIRKALGMQDKTLKLEGETTKELTSELRSDLIKPEARADLMKASG